MPANRSRTERWRESLHQIYERNGGLEIAVARGPNPPHAADEPRGVDLVWRVRILGISDEQILLENPVTLSQAVAIPPGTALTVAIVVGQNRWMFTSAVMSTTRVPSRIGGGTTALILPMPDKVERCMRREFMRVSTASLNLPEVEVYPLIDPATVFTAEIAARGLAAEADAARRAGKPFTLEGAGQVLPAVGPHFKARMLNLGGGGAGILVPKTERSSVDTARNYWLRIDLRPEIDTPLALAGRIVHTHLDSEQNTYCGVSFEFGTGTDHRTFIASQILRFSERVQHATLRRAA
jgi:c-di-GMP-binding flagellar brake protein YcgR